MTITHISLFLLAVSLFSLLCARTIELKEFAQEDRLRILRNMVYAEAAYSAFDHKRLDPSLEVFSIPTLKTMTFFKDVGKKQLTISGPGTDSIADWHDNIALYDGRANILGMTNVYVHKGFHAEAQGIYPDIKDHILEYALQGYTITFTGHSRFGPVCGYLMALFYDDHPDLCANLSMQTLAAAPGGDQDYIAKWNSIFPNALNVSDPRDIVGTAGIPPTLRFGNQLSIDLSSDFVGNIPILTNGFAHMSGNLVESFALNECNGDLLAMSLVDHQILKDMPPEEFASLNEALSELSDEQVLMFFPVVVHDAPVLTKAQEVLMIMDRNIYRTLIEVGLAFTEDALLFCIDSKDVRPNFGRLMERALELGAKKYVINSLTNYIARRIPFGPGQDAIEAGNRQLGRAIGITVGAVVNLAKGKNKAAGQLLFWEGISLVADKLTGLPISISPGLDFNTKGFGSGICAMILSFW